MKVFLLIAVAVVVVLVVTGFEIYSIRERGAETEAAHRAIEEEIRCGTQTDTATEIVKELDKDVPKRVTGTKAHYNRVSRLCIVEVNSEEFGEGKGSSAMLIDTAAKAALLWSMTGVGDSPGRRCFGPDAMPMDCAQADARWKAYMRD